MTGNCSAGTAETRQRADSGATGAAGVIAPLTAIPGRPRGAESAREKSSFSLVLARHFMNGRASSPARKVLSTGQPGLLVVAAVAAALPSASSNQTLGGCSLRAATQSLAWTTTAIQDRLVDDHF